MATRTALLNGNVINRDTDFSKHIEAVSEPGVITGLAVSSSSVAIGTALVKCERTNGDIIYAVVYNNSAQSISGDGDVYVKVSQEIIDNGELGNEDGTGIATIEVGTMPNKNALKLATISSGVVEDKRNMIKKVGELNNRIEEIYTQFDADIEDLDERVEVLEEAAAIDHLEQSGLVGELYTLNDTLFLQNTPKLADCILDCNISNVAANTQIHIQRIGSGTASNQLKLKLKMVGESTQNLNVEVRKGVQATASGEAYWYGNQVIASGSIPYTSIGTSYSEITVTLDNNFGGTKGELLDVVLYMGTVNSTNYYSVACDDTQYSEGLRYLSVNGTTRTRFKLMPYCISNGFVDTIIARVKSVNLQVWTGTPTNSTTPATVYTAVKSGKYLFTANVYNSSGSGSHQCSYKFGSSEQKVFANFDIGTISYSDYGELNAGGNAWFQVSQYHGSYGSGSVSNATLYYVREPNTIFSYPQEVKSLGELAITTLYGFHPNDKQYKGGIMMGKDTTATTGSITLGNAVGYITVNLNGEIVKIPYYND